MEQVDSQATEVVTVEPNDNPYKWRDLEPLEQDLLFSFYEKYFGNILELSQDEESPFHGRPQITYYVQKYDFKNKLLQIRTERNKEITEQLQHAKMEAVENAIRILRRHHEFVFSKTGVQVMDKEGNPLIIERLPYYKEIKAAWEILKVELGEPTTISKNEIKSGEGGLFLTNKVTFDIVDANPETPANSEGEQEASPSAEPA